MKNLSVAIIVTRGTEALPAFQERSLAAAPEGAVSCRVSTFGLLHGQIWGVMYRQLSGWYSFKMEVVWAVLLCVEGNLF